MTVTELLVDSGPALGSFDIALSELIPQEILAKVGMFGHVVIVSGRVDPAAYGDTLLPAARYVGVLRAKPHEAPGWNLRGSGLSFWLGDEDDKGHVIETPIVLDDATITDAVNAVLPPTVTLGTIHPLAVPSTRYSGTHVYQSPRAALDAVCSAFGVEYRVNPDFTVDIGRADQLYQATPQTVIVRRGAGADVDVIGIAGDYDTDETAWDYTTRVVLLGQTDTDQTIATGAANAPAVPFLDPQGNPVKFTRMISESAETAGTVTQRAQLQLNRFNRVAKSLTVTAQDFWVEVQGVLRVGDTTWVYDPDTGTTNPAYELYFRGQTYHPDVIRVAGATWAVTRGMTVAFRTGAGEWLDLTDYVEWESAGSADQLTVGEVPKTLLPRGDTTVSDRVDANAGKGDKPKPPTGLTLSTDYVQDPVTGSSSAVVRATWTAPTQNTDNSALTDLSHYLVYWKLSAATQWMATTTDETTIDLQPVVVGLSYDVAVQAADLSNNRSVFTPTLSITAAADNVGPPTPSAPTLEPYFGILRVVWDGLGSAAQPMPADFLRVDVHISATSGFTPSASTFAGSASAGGIVGHIDAPYGATRYVKLVAYDYSQNPSAPSAQASGSSVQVNDGDVASLNVGKLVSGTGTFDLVLAGRIATALSGARREMNSVGFQAWDATNTLTISLDGSNNLLTGVLQTALTGARIVLDQFGGYGRVRFFAADGSLGEIANIGGLGGILGMVSMRYQVGTKANIWNRVSATEEEHIELITKEVVVRMGGTSSVTDGAFRVQRQTSDLGGTVTTMLTVTPKSFDSYIDFANSGVFAVRDRANDRSRLQVDSNGWSYLLSGPSAGVSLGDRDVSTGALINRLWFNSSAFHLEWPVDTANLYWDLSANDDDSPRLNLINNHSIGLMMKVNGPSSGVGYHFEFKNIADNDYRALWASAFTVTPSSERFKTDMTDWDGDALAALRPMGSKTFRHKTSPQEPVKLGVRAEDAPAEIVVLDEAGLPLGMDVGPWLSMLTAAVRQLDRRIDGIGGQAA